MRKPAEQAPEFLDKSLPIPLYHQLKTILLNNIETGAWKPDEQIPTETDLAARFGVSKITVRQALRELAEQGYIRREQGRGTFVSGPELEQGPHELTSFTEDMRRRGFRATSRVLEKRIAPATAEVAAALRIPAGHEVVVLKRLRMAGGEPMGIQTAQIPVELAPGLDAEDLETQSLYEVLQKKYGLHPSEARETHFAIAVGAEDAKVLQVAPGAPALAVERITYLTGGRPFEHASSVMRGDRYRIALELSIDQRANRESQGRRPHVALQGMMR